MAFNQDQGLKELMEIFRDFKIRTGEMLQIQSINAKRHDYLSPDNNRNLDEILQYAEEQGYIETGEGKLKYFLTQKGYTYLYGS